MFIEQVVARIVPVQHGALVEQVADADFMASGRSVAR